MVICMLAVWSGCAGWLRAVVSRRLKFPQAAFFASRLASFSCARLSCLFLRDINIEVHAHDITHRDDRKTLTCTASDGVHNRACRFAHAVPQCMWEVTLEGSLDWRILRGFGQN